MLLPNKQLAGRHCTPFYFCTSAAGLSLTPKLIYAGGKQENMNNDAVFPQISLLRQADSCQLIAQETFICMSNLEGKTRGMQIDRVERESWELRLILGRQGRGVQYLIGHPLLH